LHFHLNDSIFAIIHGMIQSLLRGLPYPLPVRKNSCTLPPAMHHFKQFPAEKLLSGSKKSAFPR
jgi:hypothetical protein